MNEKQFKMVVISKFSIQFFGISVGFYMSKLVSYDAYVLETTTMDFDIFTRLSYLAYSSYSWYIHICCLKIRCMYKPSETFLIHEGHWTHLFYITVKISISPILRLNNVISLQKIHLSHCKYAMKNVRSKRKQWFVCWNYVNTKRGIVFK